jgi:hypothetical protein
MQLCEDVLERVIAGARALSENGQEPRQLLPSADARAQLAAALRDADPETALKIRRLVIAGRDGLSIAAVKVTESASDADVDFATQAADSMAADSGDKGSLLVEYLLRGHAMACASGINLERPLAEWQSRTADTLDDRAWLSFGKQLAQSNPGDWQCVAIVEPGTQGVSKLYLKLGDRAWWSFQAQLDRPTPRGVDKERRALTRKRFKGVSTNTLEAVVDKLRGLQGSNQGRALRRAARAICARIGQPVPAAG